MGEDVKRKIRVVDWVGIWTYSIGVAIIALLHWQVILAAVVFWKVFCWLYENADGDSPNNETK